MFNYFVTLFVFTSIVNTSSLLVLTIEESWLYSKLQRLFIVLISTYQNILLLLCFEVLVDTGKYGKMPKPVSHSN